VTLAVLGDDALLVLHDSPAADRLGPHSVLGDVISGLDDGAPPAARFVI
jgi:hypothetical protein